MILVGIGPCEKNESTLVFVLKKRLKNVRHHYHVISFKHLPDPLYSDEIKEHIIGLYHEKNYVTMKKIYSQDGRPPKMVQANPRLIVNHTTAGRDMVTGREMINGLRKDGIPVEGVFVRAAHYGFEKETLGKALGDDYRVPGADLINTLLDVYRQNRMDFAGTLKGPEIWHQHIDKLMVLGPDNRENIDLGTVDDRIATLALPVWFREKIRYNRPYRA
jgi:hypothetical protein